MGEGIYTEFTQLLNCYWVGNQLSNVFMSLTLDQSVQIWSTMTQFNFFMLISKVAYKACKKWIPSGPEHGYPHFKGSGKRPRPNPWITVSEALVIFTCWDLITQWFSEGALQRSREARLAALGGCLILERLEFGNATSKGVSESQRGF